MQTRPLMVVGILGAVAALSSVALAHAQEPSHEVDLQDITPVLSDRTGTEKTGLSADTVETRNGDHFEKRQNIFQLATRFSKDQGDIWMSWARLRFSDAAWLAPLGGLGAGLFVTDRGFNALLSHDPAKLRRNNTVSNLGVAALLGAGVACGSLTATLWPGKLRK